jgi:hypothetical protein
MIEMKEEIKWIMFPDHDTSSKFFQFSELMTGVRRNISPCNLYFESLFDLKDFLARSLYQIHLLLAEHKIYSRQIKIEGVDFENDTISQLINLVDDFILGKNQVPFSECRIKLWHKNGIGTLYQNVKFTDHIIIVREETALNEIPFPDAEHFYHCILPKR